jgi:hypothetical protein
LSLNLHIFFQQSRVPDRAAWQAAIDRLEYPTVLDSTLDVQNDTGFSPTTYRGQETGFEFSLDLAAEYLDDYPQIASRLQGRDQCATFRWGGDVTECAAALTAATALAVATDGLYFYPDDDLFYNAQEAVAATRQDLASL